MAKSTAKAEAMARDLKERLEFRGFSVAESKDSEGFPKLTLNADEASLRIEARDMVSKDIFRNDNIAFAPHNLYFASRDDAMDSAKVSKIMLEAVKMGIERMLIQSHATVLATAEAATPSDELRFDATWPSKGI